MASGGEPPPDDWLDADLFGPTDEFDIDLNAILQKGLDNAVPFAPPYPRYSMNDEAPSRIVSRLQCRGLIIELALM